jgi:hypothetical protein
VQAGSSIHPKTSLDNRNFNWDDPLDMRSQLSEEEVKRTPAILLSELINTKNIQNSF